MEHRRCHSHHPDFAHACESKASRGNRRRSAPQSRRPPQVWAASNGPSPVEPGTSPKCLFDREGSPLAGCVTTPRGSRESAMFLPAPPWCGTDCQAIRDPRSANSRSHESMRQRQEAKRKIEIACSYAFDVNLSAEVGRAVFPKPNFHCFARSGRVGVCVFAFGSLGLRWLPRSNPNCGWS